MAFRRELVVLSDVQLAGVEGGRINMVEMLICGQDKEECEGIINLLAKEEKVALQLFSDAYSG